MVEDGGKCFVRSGPMPLQGKEDFLIFENARDGDLLLDQGPRHHLLYRRLEGEWLYVECNGDGT